MRILVLTSLYPPSVGGAPAHVERCVRFLRREHHEVEVLVFGATEAEPALVAQQTDHDRAVPYTIHRVPNRGSMGTRSIVAMTARVIRLAIGRRRQRRPYDVVVCSVAYPCAAMARLVRMAVRTPYVVYAIGEDVSVVDQGSPHVAAVKSRILAWGFRGAAVVMAISQSTAELVRHVESSLDGVPVLPPTIDPDRFIDLDDPRTEELRRQLGLSGKKVLLTVARLTSPRKGHDVVVQALSKLEPRHPTIHYLVVGAGDQTTLRQLAQHVGVDDRLTILESISDDELPYLMRIADVYVMPSRWDPAIQEGEGFGIVYLEAAAAETPSVAGDTGGAVDAVVGGITGLTVPAESIEAVAAAIEQLLADPVAAAWMGRAGRARVIAEFSDDSVLPQLDTAIRAAASSQGA